MTVTAEYPCSAPPGTSQDRADGEAARALALGYLRFVSACWRGDACATVFETRLGAYWRAQLPPPPMRSPDAVSPHGAGGRGIRWYQIGDEVLGHVPGAAGGYHVPVSAIPRLVQCASRWSGAPRSASSHAMSTSAPVARSGARLIYLDVPTRALSTRQGSG